MIRLARDFRLIPIVLLATISLFALKVSGLVFDGGYTLAERLQGRNKTGMQITTAESVPDYPKIVYADRQAMPDPAITRPTSRLSWAQEMFNYSVPGGSDVTGSVAAKEEKPGTPQLKVSDKPPEPAKLEVAGSAYPLEPGKINSPGERAVLERLQERRQELDSRTRELEMRESLLKAAEMRVEGRVSELKELEARVNIAVQNRSEADATLFKNLITMYENMKAKDAAKIFDRLELKVLVDVATQINPRRMSDILAQMSAEAAERLTVELAARANGKDKTSAADLPKIEGKPNAN
jgi:flagellar motility protein MotE (MotC chaperone)